MVGEGAEQAESNLLKCEIDLWRDIAFQMWKCTCLSHTDARGNPIYTAEAVGPYETAQGLFIGEGMVSAGECVEARAESDDVGFVALEIHPPSHYIQEEMQERGWSLSDLATRASLPEPVCVDVLAANRAVTPVVAKALSRAFGTSAVMWLRLEAAYRLYLAGVAKE